MRKLSILMGGMVFVGLIALLIMASLLPMPQPSIIHLPIPIERFF
jgi:hypothetical protein